MPHTNTRRKTEHFYTKLSICFQIPTHFMPHTNTRRKTDHFYMKFSIFFQIATHFSVVFYLKLSGPNPPAMRADTRTTIARAVAHPCALPGHFQYRNGKPPACARSARGHRKNINDFYDARFPGIPLGDTQEQLSNIKCDLDIVDSPYLF